MQRQITWGLNLLPYSRQLTKAALQGSHVEPAIKAQEEQAKAQREAAEAKEKALHSSSLYCTVISEYTCIQLYACVYIHANLCLYVYTMYIYIYAFTYLTR